MDTSDHKIDHCRVLIVEDDPGVQQLVASALEHEGFEFVTAADGNEARRLIELEKFHVAVVDVVLPKGGDGFELANHIWRTSHTGVLLVTGRSDLEEKLAGTSHAFLLKPFRIATLLRKVLGVMRATKARCQLKHQDHAAGLFTGA